MPNRLRPPDAEAVSSARESRRVGLSGPEAHLRKAFRAAKAKSPGRREGRETKRHLSLVGRGGARKPPTRRPPPARHPQNSLER
ncbi:MAG: hypothetical protein LBR53_00710 [Deltaproteobacteria bacterium]|nr:hypothetical protein [Deltaproteobacteria bacterium]